VLFLNWTSGGFFDGLAARRILLTLPVNDRKRKQRRGPLAQHGVATIDEMLNKRPSRFEPRTKTDRFTSCKGPSRASLAASKKLYSSCIVYE
jgi:hypothetical protein